MHPVIARSKQNIMVVILFFLIISLSYCTQSARNESSEIKLDSIDQQTYASGELVDDAINRPSKHAWDLFLKVNHPAKDYSKERGVPDLSKNIGDTGIVVWETWKDAGTEVFLEDGRKPPSWEDYSLDPYLNKKGKTLEGSTAALISKINKDGRANVLESTKEFVSVELNPEDGVFENGGGETRMNRSTFDFIVKNELYNLDGLDSFRDQYLKQPIDKRKPLSFDKESIECKGMWKEFTSEELKTGADKKYYVATDAKGQKYGLLALHIITKEIPNWFWCSFRHKNGPTPQVPSVDDFGMPSQLKGTIWENYELSGTQTSFTDSKGKATMLSDPHIESGFEKSSCITCHSTSVIGPGAMPRDNGALLFTQPQVAQGSKVGEIVGTPKEAWFMKGGNENLVQLDFVYSLAFRAHKKK